MAKVMGAIAASKQPVLTPCREACPAGVDVPRYIRYIAEGRFDEALAVIREKIPFPAICGYTCVHPCEGRCARRQFDQPVAIRLLKRSAAELGGEKWKEKTTIAPSTSKRVAIVGSGPCGLTAAYYLAKAGHDVTVFEALPQAGGMMRYGIPNYRLPRDVLDEEITEITAVGVNIRTGSRVVSVEELQKDGFAAVLVASGSWKSMQLGIAGEDNDRVIDGLSFLKEVNGGGHIAVGRRVVVVGGGNSAIDAARSAVRLGAREVVVVYRRTRAQMPASAEEIEGALAEGVEIVFLGAPARILEQDGICHVVCQRMKLGKEDALGRPRPVPIPGDEFTITGNMVIVAIGQVPEVHNLDLAVGADGRPQVCPETLAAGKDGIFAAGDAVTGPASIIEAIAQGRRVAASMDRFLTGRGISDEALAQGEPNGESEAVPAAYPAPTPATLALAERLASFAPVELGYDATAAGREARRCLACDLRHYRVEVDARACKECGYCLEVCALGVFAPGARFNDRGYRPVAAANPTRCVGCNQCFYVCPDFAISIEAESRGGARA